MEGQDSIVHYLSTVRLFHNMWDLRMKRKLCDITLIVEDHKIHAHKIVLAATIPFFQAMLDSGMRETHQKDVPMPGLEYNALESLVDFAYTGRLMIDCENALTILEGASFLMLKDVEDATSKFLLKRINPKNALQVKYVADNLGKADLSQAADSFIKKKFYYVSQSCTFKSLDPLEQVELRSMYGYTPHLRPLSKSTTMKQPLFRNSRHWRN